MEIEIKEQNLKVKNAAAVADVFRSILSTESEIDKDKEHCWAMGLNQDNKVRYIELVSLGTLNGTLVHPREVFRFAIMRAVSGIIICHNHPSGNTTPSENDIRITKQLSEAGRILGIQVMDHVIIGDGVTSLKEFGYL